VLRFATAPNGGRSERLSAQLERVLAALPILPFEEPADVAYGKLRAQLEAAGTRIGGNDMLVAAQAISSGCAVVTDNEREFTRVGELNVLNWLR
jgi:tRNA(fMet)-specific endonuclease VapC